MRRLWLDEQQWTEQQSGIAEKIRSGPRGRLSGPFPVLLHHPELALHVQELGQFIRFGGVLPAQLREIAILATARHWDSDYEWWAHSKVALDVGVSPRTLDAIAAGSDGRPDDPAEALVVAFCDELLRTGRICDETYSEALDILGSSGVVELIAVCGYYSMVAMVLNVAEIGAPGKSSGNPEISTDRERVGNQ